MVERQLSTLIAEAGERLTPTDRRIAEAVLGDPTLVAFGTVTHLAEAVGTSRPSIVRFAKNLGFDGFTEFQDHVRQNLSATIFRPRDRIRQTSGAAGRTQDAIEQSIASLFEAVSNGRLAQTAQRTGAAASVWIISGETSRAGAHALRSGLSMVRPRVRLLDDRNFGSELTDVSSDDLVIVLDFHRYRQTVIRATEILADADIEIIAITDGPLSPLATLADTWFGLHIPAIGPFDSSTPAVAFAEILVAEVATQLEQAATDRFDKTETLWAATDTFHG
jgi:DNA-binding MurR/RpiR family transcriptional regulator